MNAIEAVLFGQNLILYGLFVQWLWVAHTKKKSVTKEAPLYTILSGLQTMAFTILIGITSAMAGLFSGLEVDETPGIVIFQFCVFGLIYSWVILNPRNLVPEESDVKAS